VRFPHAWDAIAQDKLRNVAERIKMSPLPAEFAPRLLAAQALVERIAARSFAELSGDRLG